MTGEASAKVAHGVDAARHGRYTGSRKKMTRRANGRLTGRAHLVESKRGEDVQTVRRNGRGHLAVARVRFGPGEIGAGWRSWAARGEKGSGLKEKSGPKRKGELKSIFDIQKREQAKGLFRK